MQHLATALMRAFDTLNPARAVIALLSSGPWAGPTAGGRR